jgi:hypothetical protein
VLLLPAWPTSWLREWLLLRLHVVGLRLVVVLRRRVRRVVLGVPTHRLLLLRIIGLLLVLLLGRVHDPFEALPQLRAAAAYTLHGIAAYALHLVHKAPAAAAAATGAHGTAGWRG